MEFSRTNEAKLPLTRFSGAPLQASSRQRVRNADFGQMTRRAFSVSILEEGGRFGLKCLLLSYFRVGDDPTGI